ncbi:MAG: hypothetical protein N2C14_23330, partial [Planctomycetales bacterium]
MPSLSTPQAKPAAPPVRKKSKSNVFCVQCGHQMVDDGSLAGQQVACLQCGNEFQMPGAAVALSHSSPSHSSPSDSYSSKYRKKSSSAGLIATVVIAGAGLFLVGLVALLTQVSAPNTQDFNEDSFKFDSSNSNNVSPEA